MGSLWQRFELLIFVEFGLLNASYGHPIGEIRGSAGDEHGIGDSGDWLTSILWPFFLGVAVLVAATGVALVGCCVCCRKSPKGFQEFTDSGSSHSLSTGGYVNPAAASSPANEFTIFPPTAPVSGAEGGGLVSFEPLPDISCHGSNAILSSNSPNSSKTAELQQLCLQKKPAAFNNAISLGLSAQDWFDDPHANFPRSQLKYLCEFGKGWFGRVVEGEAFGLARVRSDLNASPKRVIVKILHGDATPTDQMYFLHEVRYLRDLTPHPNILPLLGRCLETDPLLIILEACPNGDLKTFLLQNLATAEALSIQGILLRMACNIAAGLQYMHGKGFVHTDLAARNCLMDSDLTIKIGDYGTNIANFKDDYYCAGDVALPIRWCAPETLHCTDTTIVTKEVTAPANIWSFGILLWEICEFGRLPYSELNDEEVIVKVLSERSFLLGPPSRSCLHAHNLYHLMRLCWNPDNERPSIMQVAAILDSLYVHPEEVPSSSVEDFEHRWDLRKQSCSTAVVESVVHKAPVELQLKVGGEGDGDLELMQCKMTSHSYLPDESLELPIKHKSPSLQNLHGSLEDLAICSSAKEDSNKTYSTTGDPPLNIREKSWLHDSDSQAAADDDEDAQFVRKISEAIRDLDDVLALEKTSSSGSGTSPEEHSPSKKRFSLESHDKVDENGVLDFRLDEKNKKVTSVKGSHYVTTKSTKECNFNSGKMDGTLCGMGSILEINVTGEYNLKENEKDIDEDTSRHNMIDNVSWKIDLGCEKGNAATEKQKTPLEIAQEEEDEVWRQQVERGEFTAKVRDKSRSVQDLMVLTHIEESSEGSDSETGTSCGKSSGTTQQGPMASSSVPSFGSVGDLRSAVLGEEFLHTLERLCAANKRGYARETGFQPEDRHQNLLEEPDEKRENVEILKELDEHRNSVITSQIDENIKSTDSLSKVEPTNFMHQMQSLDNPTVLTSLSVKENLSIKDADISLEDIHYKNYVENAKSDDDNTLKPILNQLKGESSKLVTSTPLVSSNKQTKMSTEDSFNLTPVDSCTYPIKCTLKESKSIVSTADPTLPNSSGMKMKTMNFEVHLLDKSVDVEGVRGPDKSFSDSKNSTGCHNPNLADVYEPTENLEYDSQVQERLIPQSTFEKDDNLCPELLVLNSRVKSLRELAKCSLPVSQSHSRLGNGRKHLDNQGDISMDLVVHITLPGENNGEICSSLVQGKEERKFELVNFECAAQDSPVSEFPGEEDGHGLSCGISGSQSTVECTSPLTLSPITVGVEDNLISKATVTSNPCMDVNSVTHSSSDTSQFDEKFKSDGVTKEINSDFIFTVDAMVENMDAVVQPDLLLASKQVIKEVAQKGSEVASSLDDMLHISFQENVVESMTGQPEVDVNCDKSWGKSIGNNFESSHLILDLVQINTNELQKLSSDNNKLSSIVPANDTSVLKAFSVTSDFCSDLKDFDVIGKNCITERENSLEKECIQSDVLNSEECDSAGTEDSVFDFSPPGNESKSEEAGDFPGIKQIRFSSEKEAGGLTVENNNSSGMKESVEEGGRTEEEELGLLSTKQWTPDDERSSDSGFRDKGSLSESIEDACERCELEISAEEEIGREVDANTGSEIFVSCDYPEDINEEACIDETVEMESKKSQLPFPGALSEEHSISSMTLPESKNQDEFWKQQMASLRQAVGDTATLLKEASADQSSWVKGETWGENARRDSREENMQDNIDDGDRGLDEASLAALRSVLQEKLGGSNSRFGMDMKQEGGLFERANSEERLNEEEEGNEERTDITIHYDAYLAQLSPILEERESVGSSELYSPAAKEICGNSISDDSATTASVNDIVDNQVLSSHSNVKDPDAAVEDVLIVDMATNQASLVVSSPIDFLENDATSPEFTDSLEEDDDDDKDNEEFGKPENQSPKNCNDKVFQESRNSAVRCVIPPSDFWTGMTSAGSQTRPLVGFPLLLPPPPSSAPMPSPEEEKACSVERANVKKAPMFRDFEDIVALCQSQGDDFANCDIGTLEGMRNDGHDNDAQSAMPFWESESSDGNDSSSSGEFVWREGEREIPPIRAVDSCFLDPASRVYESLSEFPMAVIEEEDEGCEGEGAKEDSDSSASLMEFIPSAWNSTAEPSRSSLRSPDRKSDQKKNVSFKRQKYHCVYEYPKEEASDSEGESSAKKDWGIQQQEAPFDYSRYADWELMEGDIPECIVPGDLDSESEGTNTPATQRQLDFYKLSSEDFDFGFASVTPEAAEGEFMVSSSSRPFQYCSQDPSFSVGSQFFPGLSLSTTNVPGWMNGSRFPWSKNGEESMDVSDNSGNEVKPGDSVPNLLVDAVTQEMCQGDGVYVNIVQRSAKASDWSPQQPLSSPSSSSGSPPASPLSPTGLGELRHTRDRLKLDLSQKFDLNEVAHVRSTRKEGEESVEVEVRRMAAEEERGEASVLDVEKEDITKTAL